MLRKKTYIGSCEHCVFRSESSCIRHAPVTEAVEPPYGSEHLNVRRPIWPKIELGGFYQIKCGDFIDSRPEKGTEGMTAKRMKPIDYIHAQGINYEHSNNFGYTNIPILEFLVGRRWDEIALSFVGALHPSKLRVVRGEETTDACLGRVTIYVDKDMLITGAHQEVRVDLPEGINNGYELDNSLKSK